MDASGDMIRNLLSQSGGRGMISAPPGQFQQAMQIADQAAQNSAQCYMRNLRGECANPNLIDEDGQAMSWAKYDALKAAGKDPRAESRKNLNGGMDFDSPNSRFGVARFNGR